MKKYDAKHLSTLCSKDKGSRPLPCLNGGLLRDAGILQHPMGAGRIELPSLSPEPGVLASYTTPPRKPIFSRSGWNPMVARHRTRARIRIVPRLFLD